MSFLNKFNRILILVIFSLLLSTYVSMLNRSQQIFEEQAGIFIKNASQASNIVEVWYNLDNAMSYIDSSILPSVSYNLSISSWKLSAQVQFMSWHNKAVESRRLLHEYLIDGKSTYDEKALLYNIKNELHVFELPEDIAICHRLDVLYFPALLWVFGILSLSSLLYFSKLFKQE